MTQTKTRSSTLPQWDLNDLYPGVDSAPLKSDLQKLDADVPAFQKRYMGQVAALDGSVLNDALKEYERISEVMGRIMSYAYLLYAGNVTDAAIGKFYQAMQEKMTTLSSQLLFFQLELNKIAEDDFQQSLKDSALSHYLPWLKDLRIFKPYQLNDDLEKILLEKNITGFAAWNRLYDETLESLRFPMGRKKLTITEAMHLLSEPKAELRKKAALAIGEVFKNNIRIFTTVTNTLAKDKEIEDTWRKYPTPVSARNLSNRVEDDVVEALSTAVKSYYPQLSHRYYAMKAKWMGGDRLDYWDRNAPLPQAKDKKISWKEARKIVLDAYGRFSPKMRELGQRFFDSAWIDAPARPGKRSGAFCHGTVPSVHPYIFMNYMGKTRDVMTLAHELGHGIHMLLAAPNGALMADTPLTLAETASVFGEMLTFQALLERAGDPVKRKALLAGKVEDMLNTAVRQIAFFDFEKRVHNERRNGELTPDRLGQIWLDVQTESLGPALRFDDNYKHFWGYISHFIHAPFYVYAYAFGDCLVNSLYGVYQEALARGQGDAFVEKYFGLLAAGGTKHHKELLAPFGLNASDPAFWFKGLNVIKGYIDELERL